LQRASLINNQVMMEVSSKARENGEAYALDQAISAAANPRSPFG
jgi:hypothetical protein